MALFEDELTDTIGTAPADVPNIKAGVTTSETVANASVLVPSIGGTLEQTVGVSSVTVDVRRQSAVLAQTLGIAQSDAYLLYRSAVLSEAIGVDLTQAVGQKLGVIVTEYPAIDPVLLAGFVVSLSQTVGIAQTQTIVNVVTVLEELGLDEVLGPVFKYRLALSDTISIEDSLSRFFSGIISETIGMAPVSLASRTTYNTLAEGVGLNAADTQSLVFRIVAEDTIGLDDVDILKLIFAPTVSEGIEISAAYISPGDTFTTWVVNTRTGATTEYDTYSFNSFAKVGREYLAASSEGLFELAGDTDAGADIISHIKSGLAQFGDSKLSSFKAVYLGMRGTGDVVFRLVTGDGRTYDYAVSTIDMMTTKINLGKGLRARYFSFELITAGADFDLESVELVPLVAARRV